MTEVHPFIAIESQIRSGNALMRSLIGQRSRSAMRLEPYGPSRTKPQ